MLTRRSFLQSTAAGATLALHATTTAQQPATPVRVGVVGVGNRGTFLVQVLLALPGVEVNAICDIVPERAEKSVTAVEEKTGKRPAAYTNGDHDFENLCARDDLDAVITATPWDWHATVAVAAMRAGKYAGTEVPAATTIKDCWNLVRTSEATGMPCMMLENVCYFENVLAILRMVREGVFGDLLHCEAGYQHDTRYLHFTDDG
ncbi:MAG: Gfo/Idh/MocA family oxidoreductase [Candidatus Hydrogenedentes bacterium]|nr:Gfo/Idh/MocA family oxidoreductase [Candidatus Hydrogenedentota bacterium]